MRPLKILFVDKNDQFRKLHRIYLENFLNEVDVVERFSLQGAINTLKDAIEKDIKVDLILSDSQFSDGTGADLFLFMKEHKLSTPFVLFSEDIPELYPGFDALKKFNPKNTNILRPVAPIEFRDTILKILEPAKVLNNSTPAFQKIRYLHFWRFNKVLCDVFIKTNDNKYSRVISATKNYRKTDLDKLGLKAQDFLFIRNEDFQKFSVTFTKMPFLIMQTEGMSPEELEDALLSTHAFIHELIRGIGIAPEVIALAEKTVKEIMQKVQEELALSNLLRRMREGRDYIYDHSYLLSILSCDVAQKLNLSHDVKNKLVMASLFHDITLDDPAMAMHADIAEVSTLTYALIDQEIFKNHPQAAANMLKESMIFDADVDLILRQHHENELGSGFPEKKEFKELSSLTRTFILTHDYVSLLYRHEFNLAKGPEIKKALIKKYQDFEMGQVLDSLHFEATK